MGDLLPTRLAQSPATSWALPLVVSGARGQGRQGGPTPATQVHTQPTSRTLGNNVPGLAVPRPKTAAWTVPPAHWLPPRSLRSTTTLLFALVFFSGWVPVKAAKSPTKGEFEQGLGGWQ